jgi:hypothetical protein
MFFVFHFRLTVDPRVLHEFPAKPSSPDFGSIPSSIISSSLLNSTPALASLENPDSSLSVTVPVHLAYPEPSTKATSSSSLPPAIKSWFSRVEKQHKVTRRVPFQDEKSPVAKRTRSQKRSLSKDDLPVEVLETSRGPESVDHSMLARLKDTWSSKYSENQPKD